MRPKIAFQGMLRLAVLCLAWERLWPLLLPLLSVLALFIALGLTDLLPELPPLPHLAVLLAFLAAALAAAWRLRRYRHPGRVEALRRLERDSRLSHRPFDAETDRLAAGAGDPRSLALWALHRKRQRRLRDFVRLAWPSPGMASRDPFGLRVLPLLLLAIGLAGGWQDGGARLSRAALPDLARLAGAAPALTAWITPPPYTGLSPIALTEENRDKPLAVPAGSRLLARLEGGWGHARLLIDDREMDFEAADGGGQRLETVLDTGRRLVIRQGLGALGGWTLALMPRHPPAIAFSAPPDIDRDGRLVLHLDGSDDWGIEKVEAVLTPDGRPDDDALSVELPLDEIHPKKLHQDVPLDLTSHVWAGLPVGIRLRARNLAGDVGEGAAIHLKLPERAFTRPAARAVARARRILADDADQRMTVAAILNDIAAEPALYDGDIVVFLGLVTARSRLWHDEASYAVPSVLDLLWQVALRIEDGRRPESQSALEDAEHELEKALSEDRSGAEIDRLTDALEQTLGRYLAALLDEAGRKGAVLSNPDPDQPTIDLDSLGNRIERLRALARTGSREAARRALDELKSLLSGLTLADPGSLKDAGQARQSLKDLDRLIADERTLLDDSFRLQKDGGPAAAKEGKGLAARQEAIRHRLGGIMQSLGDLGARLPDSLGQAELSMRKARDFLPKGQLEAALAAEGEALTLLQQGRQDSARALARQLTGLMLSRGHRASGRDPLGRGLGSDGSLDDSSLHIPNDGELGLARSVLDEIRRRSGEGGRPAEEKAYLRRLLKDLY